MPSCPSCRFLNNEQARLCGYCGLYLRPIGDYILQQQIGVGGFAEVYRATNRYTGHPAAIKFLHRKLLDDKEIKQRFLREVEILRDLHSPNIVQIYDFGILEDIGMYLVMEWIDGETLDVYVHRQYKQRLSQSDALHIFSQLLYGLSRIHERRVVHRDLKPKNFMVVEEQGQIILKILDFGIAWVSGSQALTERGMFVGSTYFMAPEQFRAQKELFGPSTDLYVAGLLLAWMLTGKHIFTGSSIKDLAVQHCYNMPPMLSELCAEEPFLPALEGVVAYSLQKEPHRRFQSAMEFLQALNHPLDFQRQFLQTSQFRSQPPQASGGISLASASDPLTLSGLGHGSASPSSHHQHGVFADHSLDRATRDKATVPPPGYQRTESAGSVPPQPGVSSHAVSYITPSPTPMFRAEEGLHDKHGGSVPPGHQGSGVGNPVPLVTPSMSAPAPGLVASSAEGSREYTADYGSLVDKRTSGLRGSGFFVVPGSHSRPDNLSFHDLTDYRLELDEPVTTPQYATSSLKTDVMAKAQSDLLVQVHPSTSSHGRDMREKGILQDNSSSTTPSRAISAPSSPPPVDAPPNAGPSSPPVEVSPEQFRVLSDMIASWPTSILDQSALAQAATDLRTASPSQKHTSSWLTRPHGWKRSSKRPRTWWVVACILVGVVSGTCWWFFNQRQDIMPPPPSSSALVLPENPTLSLRPLHMKPVPILSPSPSPQLNRQLDRQLNRKLDRQLAPRLEQARTQQSTRPVPVNQPIPERWQYPSVAP